MLKRLAILLVLSASVAWSQNPPLEVKGHLRSIDGIDFVFVHGNLEEQGYAEGYLAGDKILELFEGFVLHKSNLPFSFMWDRLILPRARKRAEVPGWTREYCAALHRGMRAHFPKLTKIERLGRELEVDDLVALCLVPDIMGLMCSSFAVWNDQAPGGGPIVGRNLDYKSTPALLKNTFVTVHGPRKNRAGWLSIGWGSFGCLTGISDRGVFLAIHDVPRSRIKGETFTPRVTALQELLETLVPSADTLKDVAKTLRSHRYGMGGNVMIAWKGSETTRGAVIAELSPAKKLADGVKLRGPTSGKSHVACSNHHRIVKGEPRRCWRYEALRAGAAKTAPSGLGSKQAWELIEQSKVNSTLYQVVVDLNTGTLGLRFRRKPHEDVWSSAQKLDFRALLAEARAEAASTK